MDINKLIKTKEWSRKIVYFIRVIVLGSNF